MNERIFSLIRLLILILYYTISCTGVLISQSFSSYHYTSSEGLASSSVYDLIQDRSGFMWFATVNGVSKFDGHAFRNYSTSDGLNSSNIINLTEDPGGEIYFGNYEKGYNVFRDNKIENFSDPTEKNKTIKGMFVLKDTLYSYTVENITRVSSKNALNVFNSYPELIGINKIVKTENETIIAATTRGLYKFENNELIKMNIKGFDDEEIFWIYGNKHNEIIAGARGKIFEINNYEVTRIIEVNLFNNNNVIRICKDTNGNIWFSIMKKGFFFIEAGTEKITDMGGKLGLDKSLVNNFLEDNERNMWVSTYGDGVFCLNNRFIMNYSQQDGLSNNKVLAIEKDASDRIFIGTLDSLNVLDNDSIKIIDIKIKTSPDYMYINGLKNINDLIYISGTFKTYGNVSMQSYMNDKLYLFTSSAFCITKGNEFINGGWGNEIIVQPFPPVNVNQGDTTYLFDDIRSLNKVYCIFADSRKNLWVSTASGLCKITSGRKTFFTSNEILNSTIKSIIQDKNDRVWFAGDKGIASYGLNDSAITNYIKIREYDLTSSNVMASDRYNRLWVGTMNGVFILNNDSVKILNTETGLPSAEILSLYYDTTKDYMWIGTANGLSSLNVSEFDKSELPPVKVKLKSVKANDSVYLYSENYIFEPDRNNIQIDFSAINFSSPASVNYQYKININNEWINIPDDHINFSSLEKGDYKLSVRGKVINSRWGEPEIISFTVLPYFTETFLFRGSLTVLLLAGIAFAAHRRIKFINARGKEKFDTSNQINELKHKALSSMMNPHFIFNSLNSVQYLVNSDRKREANDYISLMAKLIRMNLDSAANSFIRLDEEIKRLDLYLKIEKLRFSDKFKYEITAGDDINPESILIPNMIIQPFVENSIWHGIMPLDKEGFIKLSFNFENVSVNGSSFRFFVIRITDNGIGLSEAQKNKKEGHISKGIEIIQDRLILLSKEKNLPQPVIEDLNLKNKNTQGTEVVLSIPPDLYKII